MEELVTKFLYKEITSEIIGAAFTVHGELGYGFLEKVIENAMVVELRQHRHMKVQHLCSSV